MSSVRPPAVAGTFYPADPAVLQQAVDALLATVATESAAPKALIVPHAGYVYSGPIAATGFCGSGYGTSSGRIATVRSPDAGMGESG